MKTIKGLPTSVVVDSENALREVEKLMRRASESNNLNCKDATRLIDTYKEARRQWLDDHYELNEEHLKALLAADDRITAAARETIDIVCRTLKYEASLPEEERTICKAYVHLEEEGLPIDCHDEYEMTEEKDFLWYLLFSEEGRKAYTYWGFPFGFLGRREASINDVEEWRSKCLKRLEKNPDRYHLSYFFWEIRDQYSVALQDMARIAEFKLTIDYDMQ